MLPWKALTRSLAHAQNKGLSKYQRRASWLPTGPSPLLEVERQACNSQSWKTQVAAISAPEIASSTKLLAGSQLLTASSCDPGWLTSARRVTAWDQLPRGDTGTTETVHFRRTWETQQLGPQRWLTRTARLGRCTRQAPGCLSCSDPGRAQKACPTESVALWSAQEPEPEKPRAGKSTKGRACFGQHTCRAAWSLRTVEPENTRHGERGKPSVVHALRPLPAHASHVCLQCCSLPTTQLNKWA